MCQLSCGIFATFGKHGLFIKPNAVEEVDLSLLDHALRVIADSVEFREQVALVALAT